MTFPADGKIAAWPRAPCNPALLAPPARFRAPRPKSSVPAGGWRRCCSGGSRGYTTPPPTSRRYASTRRSTTPAACCTSSSGWESTWSARWIIGWRATTRSALVVSDYYDNAHFVVTFALLGWLWWARAEIYRPLRNTLLLCNALAFVVFWRFPVAPPRMLGGFVDVVASSGALGSWHGHSGLASHANELAALPSLHLAWAAWCALAVWRATRRVWARALGDPLSRDDDLRGAGDRQPLCPGRVRRAAHVRRLGGDRGARRRRPRAPPRALREVRPERAGPPRTASP